MTEQQLHDYELGNLHADPAEAVRLLCREVRELRKQLDEKQRLVDVAERAFRIQEAFEVEGRGGKFNALQISKAWLQLEQRAEAAESSHRLLVALGGISTEQNKCYIRQLAEKIKEDAE